MDWRCPRLARAIALDVASASSAAGRLSAWPRGPVMPASNTALRPSSTASPAAREEDTAGAPRLRLSLSLRRCFSAHRRRHRRRDGL